MLLRLIFISVNTGLSSALLALLCLVLVRLDMLLTQHFPDSHRTLWQLVMYPTDIFFAAVYLPLCTVYCNTLLANLNVRSFVRGGSEMQQLNPLSTFVVASACSERTEV